MLWHRLSERKLIYDNWKKGCHTSITLVIYLSPIYHGWSLKAFKEHHLKILIRNSVHSIWFNEVFYYQCLEKFMNHQVLRNYSLWGCLHYWILAMQRINAWNVNIEFIFFQVTISVLVKFTILYEFDWFSCKTQLVCWLNV